MLAFNPNHAILYSASWDKTVKIWDVYSQSSAKETLPVGSDGKLRSIVNLFLAILMLKIVHLWIVVDIVARRKLW